MTFCDRIGFGRRHGRSGGSTVQWSGHRPFRRRSRGRALTWNAGSPGHGAPSGPAGRGGSPRADCRCACFAAAHPVIPIHRNAARLAPRYRSNGARMIVWRSISAGRLSCATDGHASGRFTASDLRSAPVRALGRGRDDLRRHSPAARKPAACLLESLCPLLPAILRLQSDSPIALGLACEFSTSLTRSPASVRVASCELYLHSTAVQSADAARTILLALLPRSTKSCRASKRSKARCVLPSVACLGASWSPAFSTYRTHPHDTAASEAGRFIS